MENDQIRVNFATNEGRADGDAHGGTSALYTGAPNKEYSSKQLKHRIVKRILVFKSSENSRAQMVSRTDILRKLTLGAPAYTLCMPRSLSKDPT